MRVLFYPSSAGYGYFYSLFQELKQAPGTLSRVGSKSVELKQKELVAADGSVGFVLTETDLKSLIEDLFERIIGTRSTPAEYILEKTNLVAENDELFDSNGSDNIWVTKPFSSQLLDWINAQVGGGYSRRECFVYYSPAAVIKTDGCSKNEYILHIESFTSVSPSLRPPFYSVTQLKIMCVWYKIECGKNNLCSLTSLAIFRTIFTSDYHLKAPNDDANEEGSLRSKNSRTASTNNRLSEHTLKTNDSFLKSTTPSKASDLNYDDDASTIISTAADSYTNYDPYYYSCSNCGSMEVSCRSKKDLFSKNWLSLRAASEAIREDRDDHSDGPFTVSKDI